MTEPTVPQPDSRPSPPPLRRVPRPARAAIVVVVCAALVAAVTITLVSVPAPLPAPRTLPHDPVPAERIRWSTPVNCGINAATRKALIPDATLDVAGDEGSCRWYANVGTSGDLSLKVTITAHHAGPGVPGVTDAGDSSVAAAISALNVAGAYQGATSTPLTGLGDEAILSETPSTGTRSADVEFRTDNVTVQAEYSTTFNPDSGRPKWVGRLRAGALRAAADVARALGAPAAPTVTAAPPRASAVHTPASACDVVPSGLRDRLLGEDDQNVDPGDQDGDPYLSGSLLRGDHDQTCDLSTDGRKLTVAIATGTRPTAVRDASREYLRRYLEARAEKPLSGDDDRYFHALSGLGDQAFCAYLEEGSSLPNVESPARVVVRAGPALISVVYSADTTGHEDDTEPLTRDDAVDGAYAVAVQAVHAVRP